MRLTKIFGNMLRLVDLKVYTYVRWKLKSVMGNPMAQLFLLPLLVRKNDIVIDIGANIGEITVKLAAIVGKGGTVHSFEPIQNNFDQLKANIESTNMSSRTVLYKMGLSDKIYTATFTVPKDRDTEATLIPHHDEAWIDYDKVKDNYIAEECDVKTLESIIDENIAFIKCDVEGGEFLVLKGAERILKSKNPPILMLESYEKWTNDYGYHPRDMFKYLRDVGRYEIYWISPSGLKLIPPESDTIPGIFYQWVDFICIVPEVHKKRIDVTKFIDD